MTSSARGGSGWRCGRHDEYLIVKEEDEVLLPGFTSTKVDRSLDEVQINGQKVGDLLRGGGTRLSLLRRRSRSQSRSDPDAPIAKGG